MSASSACVCARAAASRASAARAAASESARRWAAAMESARCYALLSGAGVGAGAGAGGVRRQPAMPTEATTRSERTAERLVMLISRNVAWWDASGTSFAGEAGRPCRQANRGAARQLTRAPALRVEHPELPGTPPRGDEHQVTAVGSPRRVLVAAVTGQLLETTVAQAHRHHLKGAGDARLERHLAPVGRPVRTGAIRTLADVEWREQVRVGAVRVHGIDLRMAGASRHERDPPPIRAEAGCHVVAAASDRDPARGSPGHGHGI